MTYHRILSVLFLLLISGAGYSQYSSYRAVKLATPCFDVKIDSFSVYASSFEVFCSGNKLVKDDYTINYLKSTFSCAISCEDSLELRFRVFPMDLSKTYQFRDTSIIFNEFKDDRELFLQNDLYAVEDVFGGSTISRNGSISRGVTFGNNQDLGINSSLNLELSGDIGPNLKLLASVSDDNLPIQPDGNTNKLQEFDQVFVQIYNDRLKLIAGDFWLYKPNGYFMNYRKRAQGLSLNYHWGKDSTNGWQTQLSGALSKGKFARQIIQGIEGNQGPYRLKGNENEPFIIILSGTERVFIDGKQLSRGQEFDYVINYNTSEVTFTSKNLITKDSRIVIEFQYSDQNYARSLTQTSIHYQSDKFNFWLNAYSEQDAKNQTLQQDLSQSQKQLLSQIGDSLALARTNSIDSVGFLDNQVLYKMIDSLGFDSVLVYSVHPDSAFYRAVFTYVGPGKGDYIFSNFNALGRVYKWVAPIGGISQGDYVPSRIIITPKKKQMLSSGIEWKLGKYLKLKTEFSATTNDLNTFSPYDRRDDFGFSNYTKLIGTIPLMDKLGNPLTLETFVELEALDKNFSPIEQYRAVEFDRDWNTRNQGYKGNQISSALGATLKSQQKGAINLAAQQYGIGNDYFGIRAATDGRWKQNGFNAIWDGSFLSSNAVDKNQFLRHRSDISQAFGWFKIGYIDDQELNTFRNEAGTLATNSYGFFDYQFYLANSDSIKNNFKLFYRERLDQRTDTSTLSRVAKARSFGSEVAFTEWTNHQLKLISSYRELKILDSNLIDQNPENTLLGRIDYEMKVLKGALSTNSFYEVGSGLELKKEFLYIQVNDGQGVYTWIDYNGDGIKDLNEFEVAQFVDQASYIRVFTPSNEYVKTYSNEFNQSINFRPERLWSNKKGILGIASRFSDQARFRVLRKTNIFEGGAAFNPFVTDIRDSNLISTNSTVRNSLFFNRTSSIFSAEYVYQKLNSKTLLATGFDAKANEAHELSFRWNIKRIFAIELKGETGTKSTVADYTSGRNYALDYKLIKPSLIYQPNTVFRVTLDGRYSIKTNDVTFGGETAEVKELGTTLKYNQTEKGSFQSEIKMVSIGYDGIQNSALGFEMLEALKPGINYTWNIGYQRSISKNLQISIQYNGRKSEGNKTIHSGGMEVRALF
jgi:hypothetical protein